jgi:excisionase family DNA binding protein
MATGANGHGPEITRHTPFEELPELLEVVEFTAYTGIGRSLAYDLIKRGELEHVRFGRIIRIPKTALGAMSGDRAR